jgi:nucleotide-binding universal stress UspA family protein
MKPEDTPIAYRRLLVPIDSSAVADHAISQSLALARQLGAAVTGFVVEALPALPISGTNLAHYQREVLAHEASTAAHAQGLLAKFRAAAESAGVAFDGEFERQDDVAAAIASMAERRQCDLIVMATHGRGAFGQLLFGSQTKRVMALTKRPLLVLH